MRARAALVVAFCLHVVEDATDVLAGEITFQGPRRVRVAAGESHVGYIAEQHALVGQGLRELDPLAIDRHLKTAEQLEIEARSRHNQIGLDLCARMQPNAPFSEAGDVVGDDRSPTGLDRGKEIVVGCQTTGAAARGCSGA